MTENKKISKSKAPSKTTEVAVVPKKETRPAIKPSKKPSAITKAKPKDLWQAFDETFEKFRNDFENILFPSELEVLAMPEVRVPAVDLEDKEKEFILKAEMPGFKKEDIEINVQDDSVEISGAAGWTYNEKDQSYVCKERACKTFYRYVDLPEEIKVDNIDAKLSEGVLELTLPKKTVKQKRKVSVK